jgi:predicted ATPase
LQRGLHQLVVAEFLYQRGLPPYATYLFKHTLIQEAAYQSLLKSARQQYHQRIAQVLADRSALHRGGLPRASGALLAAGGPTG